MLPPPPPPAAAAAAAAHQSAVVDLRARARHTQSSLLRVSERASREGGREERAVGGNGCSKNRGVFGLRRELNGGQYEDLSVL